MTCTFTCLRWRASRHRKTSSGGLDRSSSAAHAGVADDPERKKGSPISPAESIDMAGLMGDPKFCQFLKRAQTQAWRGSRYYWKSGNGAFILARCLSDHSVGDVLLLIAAPPAPLSNTVSAALLKQRTRPLHRVIKGVEL